MAHLRGRLDLSAGKDAADFAQDHVRLLEPVGIVLGVQTVANTNEKCGTNPHGIVLGKMTSSSG